MSLHTAMHTIGVIGAGAWGTALARHIAEKGLTVTLWAYEQEVVEAIQSKRENSLYLPSVPLPTTLTATNSLAEAVHSVDSLVFAVPSHAARAVLQQIQPLLHEAVSLVSATKGIEEESLKLMTQVMDDILPPAMRSRILVLSGPSFATEVSRGQPTALCLAGSHV